MSWILANWYVLLAALMTVVGTASTVAAVLAPLTKASWDDKLASRLRWVYEALRKLGLNDLAPPKLPEPPGSE